jgi:glycosyltransferase involved in cell wall biosynthesis
VTKPIVTIAIPSLNQGRYLDSALASIFAQRLSVEVFLMDGGSADRTLDVIAKWKPLLAGWRSRPDNGQAAAINEGIARGSAPYVAWLNSDDLYLPEGLKALLDTLEAAPHAPAAYGRALHETAETGARKPVWVQHFSERALALRCIICQPATLIRRSAWERIGGLDTSLKMAMDYDLWWRLYRHGGPFAFTAMNVAINRDHAETKTNINRCLHYTEAISTVRKYHGCVPLKWYLYQPYAVWLKSFTTTFRRS